MKISEFTKFKDLCKDKQYVEEYLQYCGYLFLNLTTSQAYKIANILVDAGFPVVTDITSKSGKSVELSNGLRLHLECISH